MLDDLGSFTRAKKEQRKEIENQISAHLKHFDDFWYYRHRSDHRGSCKNNLKKNLNCLRYKILKMMDCSGTNRTDMPLRISGQKDWTAASAAGGWSSTARSRTGFLFTYKNKSFDPIAIAITWKPIRSLLGVSITFLVRSTFTVIELLLSFVWALPSTVSTIIVLLIHSFHLRKIISSEFVCILFIYITKVFSSFSWSL